MTNAEALTFLLSTRDTILEAHPFPEGSDVDPRFAFAMGQILAAAMEGIAAVAENRQYRLPTPVPLDRNRLNA